MEMKSVASSNISQIGYDEETNTLHITFKSGGTYAYEGVSLGDYQRLMVAQSPGGFFHTNIKPKYGARKL